MLKIFSFLILLVSGFFLGRSQSTGFKKGIYKTWEELKTKTPSSPLDGNITYKKINSQSQISNAHRIAVLEYSKNKTKKIGSVIAFHDGNELYINDKSKDLKSRPYYTFVEVYSDRYGIFDAAFSIDLNTDVGAGNFPMYCKITGLKIVDFKTGTTTPILNKGDLKKLLADDTELSKQYKAEKNKSQKIKLYVIEYLMRKSV